MSVIRRVCVAPYMRLQYCMLELLSNDVPVLLVLGVVVLFLLAAA
jgi:hypothetical protein